MVNYNKGIIYKICCKDTKVKEEYIGSTCNWYKRKNCHKSDYCNENNKNYNYAVYQCIRANGGWDNWEMIQVEQYSAKDKKDLHTRERYWLEQLKCVLNKQTPSRSNAEYYINNKDKIVKQQVEYKSNNKERIAERWAEKVTCECGSVIQKYYLSTHKKSQKHIRLSPPCSPLQL